jgi:dipeptidyl aminopeptidase/acylaminoacyl peptidase
MKNKALLSLASALLAAGLQGCAPSAPADVTAAAAAASPERICSTSSDERVRAMSDASIGLTSALGLAAGRYALPATAAPTQLVVMFHGNHNDSCSWRNHLRSAAERGAVAVAMDYTGQHDRDGVDNWGWFVKEGAGDSIAAARHFLGQYPSITEVFAFGVSMGGNASGMAVASPDAVRLDGTTPLFDYWVDVEGVNNLIEEYLIIRAVEPVNGDAAVARAEMEEEAGGSLEEVPAEYADLTNLLRAPAMRLRGAVVVHGVDDGLVSTSQSPEMAAALNWNGVPTHLYTVFLKGDAESGGTATAIVAGPVGDGLGQPYESPFAGHGWEGSSTHLVIKTGLDALWALLGGAQVEAGETPVAGN